MHFFKYCCWDIGRSHRSRLPPKDREKFSENFFDLLKKKLSCFGCISYCTMQKEKFKVSWSALKVQPFTYDLLQKKLHCEPNLISVAWSCGNQVHENMISRAYIRAWFEWVHAISIKMWVISLWQFSKILSQMLVLKEWKKNSDLWVGSSAIDFIQLEQQKCFDQLWA